MIRLGDYIQLSGGGTPSKDKEEYWGGNVPWMSVKDLKSDTVNSTIDSITQLGVENSATRIIPANTLIVATRMAVGKATISQIDTAINQDLKAIEITGDIDKKYLFYLLKSKQSYFERVASGATVKGIKIEHLTDLKIPLPPLPEQKKIAAILDAADAYRQKTKALLTKYDELTQSLFLEMFGDPVMNPKGWGFRILKDLVTKLGDGIHGTPQYSHDGEYHFINGNNLEKGRIVINENTKRVSKEEYKTHKRDLDSNTFLVSINGSIGKIAFYGGEKVMLGKSACYFNLKENVINKSFLYHVIDSPYFIRYATGQATGSTIKNVSLKSMRNFPIPFPPINLQNRFAERIQAIEKQKAQAQQSLDKAEELFQSLLQRAFKGSAL